MSSNNNEKMTFLQWIDNLWYHYKAQIVIGGLGLIIFAVCLVQCVFKDEHDVFIYAVGGSGLTAEASDRFMQDMSENFAIDANDDGEKNVGLKVDKFTMAIGPDGNEGIFNAQNQVSEIGAFQLELAEGDAVVYIFQKEFFYPNLKFFEPFQSALGYVPENAIEGKGMRIGSLKAYKNSKLSSFPEDYIICLAEKSDRFDSRYYEGNVQFLKNLIEYTPEGH